MLGDKKAFDDYPMTTGPQINSSIRQGGTFMPHSQK